MALQSATDQDRLYVASVDKAFQVLEAFSGDRRDLGISDIMRRTGLDKSAIQRYTHTLERLEYLVKDDITRRYALSKRSLVLSQSFLRTDPLVLQANPYLVDLRSKCDARVGLACLHDDYAMYLSPLQSNNVAYRTAHAGFTVPLYCSASGRLFLSYRDDNEIRSFLESIERPKVTPNTITDIDQILSEIEIIRRNGFSITEQELRLGDINLAVPVTNNSGQVIASVVVVCNRPEWSRQRMIDEIFPLASAAAHSINADS